MQLDFVITFSYMGGRRNKILVTQVGIFFRGRLINLDDGWLVQDMEIRWQNSHCYLMDELRAHVITLRIIVYALNNYIITIIHKKSSPYHDYNHNHVVFTITKC